MERLRGDGVLNGAVSPPVDRLPDGWPLVGRLAAEMLRGTASGALDLLVTAFHLHSACLTGRAGEAMPTSRAWSVGAEGGGSMVSLPVRLADGAAASLSVVGAHADQLPALQVCADVLVAGLVGPERGRANRGGALLQADEADHDELAAELHDDAVQQLVAARYLCDAAVGGADVVPARDAVQEALRTLRRTLWRLRSRGREPGRFTSTLDALSRHLEEAGHAALLVTVDPVVADGLSGHGGVLAYRLIQSVATVPDAEAVQVTVSGEHPGMRSIEVCAGRRLLDLQRWHLRAEALGGELIVMPTGVRLLLPSDQSGNNPAH